MPGYKKKCFLQSLETELSRGRQPSVCVPDKRQEFC